MDENMNYTLYIPQGITDHEDGIAPGIGGKEAKQIVLTTLAGIVVGLLAKVCGATLPSVMITIFLTACCSVGFYRKTDNISMFDHCKWIVRYYKSNKYMPYAYLSEWGDEIEKDH